MKPFYTVIILLMSMIMYSAAAATYYVHPAGNDTSTGLSPQEAWASIDKINQTVLAPGDTVLFRGGSTFAGIIYFEQTGGTAAQPIVIGSYGVGRATIYSGDNVGLYIYNAAGYKITDLIFQGSGRTANQSAGVAFYMDLPNTRLQYIAIENVEAFGYRDAGISIGSGNGSSGYDGVYISNCSAHDNGNNGISTYAAATLGHRNVYVRNSKAYNNSGIPELTTTHSGSGIVLGGVDGGVIEYCEAYNNGWLNAWKTGGPVGIWGYHCNNLIIQYNESHHNRTGTTKDGGGFDLDGGSTNCIMQYNYSHDNEGAGYLLAQYNGAPPMKNITVRYNISENDGRKNGYGAIHLWSSGASGGIQDAHIYNNTVYVSPAKSGAPKAVFVESGGTTVATFRNNILQTTGGLSPVNVQVTPHVRFEGNSYWTTGSTPKFVWGATTYTSLEAWRTATGQELRNGTATGYFTDPQLKDPGKGITVAAPEQLYLFQGYELKETSPLIGKGLNLLTEFDIDPGQTDFWGNSISRRNDLCIGAHQVTKQSKACLYAGVLPLSFGEPAGGTYTGQGIADGKHFDPLAAGTGNHALTYTYTDTQGAMQTSHHTISVLDASATTWTGSSGTSNWFEGNNWSTCVPTSLIDAHVPSTDAQLTILPGIKAGEYAAVKNLSGTGMLTVADNGTLEITGSFTGAGLAASPLSALILSGGEQAIPAGSYGSLVLKGTGPKELAGAVFIANSLDLQQGHLYLASHNLTVAKAARILNFSPASYLVTNGTGSLKINSIGAETILFPIGTALSYTPASLSNYGVTDNFSMRVEEGFYLDSKGGTYLSEGAVNKTWHVEEEVTGGSDVSMTFQWNASDELANFARTESFASHYENNQWNKVANSQGTLADGSTVHTYTISMHGITSFSPFGVSSTENSYGPLPVSLSKFTAKRQGNETVLEWETASEQGNKGFYVELSADGKQFRKLGFVASKAVNSQVALHYSYRDTEAGKQGTRYYRLQQVDLDGTTSYSPVKAVEFTPEPVTLAVYPNPFSSRVTVALESLRAQQLYLSLTDSQGKVLLEKAEAVSAGINDVPLDLSHVNPKGLFILTVRYGEVTHHVKLLRH